MDDHTFCLLRSLDDKIRRAAILIEQHQIYLAELDAYQRSAASNILKALQEHLARLLFYRSALLIEPSREYIN
jgi:hypothetical protein